MITSTTGQTAVRLPPQSRATASDVRTQADNIPTMTERQLEGAAEVIHGSCAVRAMQEGTPSGAPIQRTGCGL